MERRFLSPSMSPVSSITSRNSSFAVIFVMAAGVSSMALAICARELMRCGRGIAESWNDCFLKSMIAEYAL